MLSSIVVAPTHPRPKVQAIAFPRPCLLQTNGAGLWTEVRRAVRIVGLSVHFVYLDTDADECDVYGELRVAFSRRTWNVYRDGVIYTDPRFLRELRTLLRSLGLRASTVDYSEYGMQAPDYVSLDVDAAFLRSMSRLAAPPSPRRRRR